MSDNKLNHKGEFFLERNLNFYMFVIKEINRGRYKIVEPEQVHILQIIGDLFLFRSNTGRILMGNYSHLWCGDNVNQVKKNINDYYDNKVDWV